MSQEPQSLYIIHGGQEGADRLSILAEVMWPYTKPFLINAGLQPGMKCLDVGCGNGEITTRILSKIGPKGSITGIDFDPKMIQIANAMSTEHHDQVDFRVIDIEQQIPDNGPYDFIFCRFVLSHLKSPQNVISTLYSLLNPNGILAIEDVDFDGHFCHPPSHAFDRYVELYRQTALQKGANPLIGRDLSEMIAIAGFEYISLHVSVPTFQEGNGKHLALLTMQAIQDAVFSTGLASEEEVQQILTELKHFTDNAKSMMSLPRIFQVSGRSARV